MKKKAYIQPTTDAFRMHIQPLMTPSVDKTSNEVGDEDMSGTPTFDLGAKDGADFEGDWED